MWVGCGGGVASVCARLVDGSGAREGRKSSARFAKLPTTQRVTDPADLLELHAIDWLERKHQLVLFVFLFSGGRAEFTKLVATKFHHGQCAHGLPLAGETGGAVQLCRPLVGTFGHESSSAIELGGTTRTSRSTLGHLRVCCWSVVVDPYHNSMVLYW